MWKGNAALQKESRKQTSGAGEEKQDDAVEGIRLFFVLLQLGKCVRYRLDMEGRIWTKFRHSWHKQTYELLYGVVHGPLPISNENECHQVLTSKLFEAILPQFLWRKFVSTTKFLSTHKKYKFPCQFLKMENKLPFNVCKFNKAP